MNAKLKNLLAIIVGLFLGSLLNMGLVIAGSLWVPVPEGVDVTTSEGLKAGMHLFKPINFVFPFLAHALGTLVGAFSAAFLASAGKEKYMALVIGILFLTGGFINVMLLPSPMWFNILDLGVAYLPMSFLALRLLPEKKAKIRV